MNPCPNRRLPEQFGNTAGWSELEDVWMQRKRMKNNETGFVFHDRIQFPGIKVARWFFDLIFFLLFLIFCLRFFFAKTCGAEPAFSLARANPRAWLRLLLSTGPAFGIPRHGRCPPRKSNRHYPSLAQLHCSGPMGIVLSDFQRPKLLSFTFNLKRLPILGVP